jgi:hypothetical protein
MASELLPEASLRRLRLSQVRAYAERRGWERGETFRDRIVIFGRDPRSLEQLLVPTNPDLDDFVELMQRVVQQLAEAELRSSASVLDDLLSVEIDTLRVSVRSPASECGTLPLEDGLALLEGARRSLLASACTVLAPENRYHPRMSRTEAEDLLHSCEMGQTERGSFTITVRAPVGAPDLSARLVDSNDVPFARKTTETLATSLSRIATAIDLDHVDGVLTTPSGTVQITANLCDALLQMQPEQESFSLAFSFTWAATYPVRVTTAPVILRSEHFPIINLMSHRLRGESEPSAAEFIAHVDELRGSIGSDGRRQGDIRLTLYSEDEAIKAAANLTPDECDAAVRAHLRGRRVVIQGLLNRGPRLSVIKNIARFDVLEH